MLQSIISDHASVDGSGRTFQIIIHLSDLPIESRYRPSQLNRTFETGFTCPSRSSGDGSVFRDSRVVHDELHGSRLVTDGQQVVVGRSVHGARFASAFSSSLNSSLPESSPAFSTSDSELISSSSLKERFSCFDGCCFSFCWLFERFKFFDIISLLLPVPMLPLLQLVPFRRMRGNSRQSKAFNRCNRASK
jgi:hypothetical protein